MKSITQVKLEHVKKVRNFIISRGTRENKSFVFFLFWRIIVEKFNSHKLPSRHSRNFHCSSYQTFLLPVLFSSYCMMRMSRTGDGMLIDTECSIKRNYKAYIGTGCMWKRWKSHIDTLKHNGTMKSFFFSVFEKFLLWQWNRLLLDQQQRKCFCSSTQLLSQRSTFHSSHSLSYAVFDSLPCHWVYLNFRTAVSHKFFCVYFLRFIARKLFIGREQKILRASMGFPYDWVKLTSWDFQWIKVTWATIFLGWMGLNDLYYNLLPFSFPLELQIYLIIFSHHLTIMNN